MNPWLIWQLADSAFPSGGFAHSGGMEAAWQHGVIRDAESLVEFMRSSLRQMRRGVLRFVAESWRSSDAFGEIDSRCDLFLNNHIANRASRAQGRALLSAAHGVFEREAIDALARAARKQEVAGHVAPAFGLICRELEVDEPTAGSLFEFIFLRNQISVAVRLGIIGPIQGQQIQAHFSATETNEPLSAISEAVQISPVLDLVQATQDRLYSRLFQS